jgi:transposase
VSFAHLSSRIVDDEEVAVFRAIGMDVHRDFCEVAIVAAGRTLSVGRIATAGEIARILRPHVGAVEVVSPHDTGISRARAKTDRLDARALAKLLAAGELDAVWMPEEWTRAMRRRLARRSQLVRARTRAKNEIHAVLIRRLQGRPPVTDVFGVRGRQWLSGLEVPDDERETIAGCLRHIDFLDGEVAALDRAIASEALRKPEVLRLMTVPGVSAITASTFVAAIGDIGRFRSARQLVGYLGLDPRLRQSGPGPARHGRITKQGSASVRHVLVEAAWTAVRAPGPMRAFYARVPRGAARRSPRSPRHASARICSGVCSPASSTTPSDNRRWRAARSAASSSPPAHRHARARSQPVTACATSRSVTPNARSPSRPRTPTGARSPTRKQRGRRRRTRA